MSNEPVKSRFEAIIKGKCPRCRRGDVFKYPITKISKFNVMYDDCPVCGLHFEIEPGYFYSAMYISYGLSSGITLVMGLITYKILHDPALWVYATVIIACMLLLSPLSLRFSRMLTLHYISPIRFDPKYQGNWDKAEQRGSR
ncbi:MAG: DUF983 domain-containing protein [Bacteroidota bacterium]|nr:DUF983 domain-containing protein [Bacteroidota bacterium]